MSDTASINTTPSAHQAGAPVVGAPVQHSLWGDQTAPNGLGIMEQLAALRAVAPTPIPSPAPLISNVTAIAVEDAPAPPVNSAPHAVSLTEPARETPPADESAAAPPAPSSPSVITPTVPTPAEAASAEAAPATVVAGPVTRLQDATSAADILRLAGLDWEVQRERLLATGMFVDSDATMPAKPMLEHYVCTRMDTQTRFAPVGRRYRPIQNAYIADLITSSGILTDSAITEAGGLDGGRLVFFDVASRNLQSAHTIGSKTVTGSYGAKIVNSHDGTVTLRVRPTVWLDGKELPMFTEKGMRNGIAIRHTASIREASKDVFSSWHAIMTTASETMQLMQQMADVSIDDRAMRAILIGSMRSSVGRSAGGAIADPNEAQSEATARATALEEKLMKHIGNPSKVSLLDLAAATAAYVDGRKHQPVLNAESKGKYFTFKNAMVEELVAYMRDADYVLKQEMGGAL